MKNQISLFFTLLLVIQLTLAQNIIRGTVSDINGPLPGANVIEQGTTNGVSTDFDGNFRILCKMVLHLKVVIQDIFHKLLK